MRGIGTTRVVENQFLFLPPVEVVVESRWLTTAAHQIGMTGLENSGVEL